MGIIMGVKWLRAVMMFAFVGAFALATNHCRLEVLKGLEFLVCCSHGGESEAAPHQDADCETDGCASLEDGLYKSEDGRIPTVAPLISAIELAAAHKASFKPPAPLAHFLSSSVPELSVSWQFLLRAASPPRAPSLAS